MTRLVRGRLAPVYVALVVTAGYAAYVVWRLSITGQDPSFFVVAGPPFVDGAQAAPNLHLFPDGRTYDGQFFYRLARDPLSNADWVDGVRFDEPAYRQQRILYPLIAWAISAGNWQLTPAALIMTNVLAVAALAYASAAYVAWLGRSALLAAVIPLYPGYLMTISRDLAELVEAALMVGGLVLILRGRYGLAAAALMGALLAKETMLVVPIAGLIVWGTSRLAGRTCRTPVWVWLGPVLLYVAWSGVLTLRWGVQGPGQGGLVNFGPPAVALIQSLAADVSSGSITARASLAEIALVLGALLAFLVTQRWRMPPTDVVALACVLYAVAALLYSSVIWQDDYAFMRALHELFVTASLSFIGAGVWAGRTIGSSTFLVWLGSAIGRGHAP